MHPCILYWLYHLGKLGQLDIGSDIIFKQVTLQIQAILI